MCCIVKDTAFDHVQRRIAYNECAALRLDCNRRLNLTTHLIRVMVRKYREVFSLDFLPLGIFRLSLF